MNEKELSKKFANFLVQEKGYPEESLLFEAPILLSKYHPNLQRYIADLVILDTTRDNYLALIEFRKIDMNSFHKDGGDKQIQQYLKALNKPELPAYLVTSSENGDFFIILVKDEAWLMVEKENFPQYQTLQSKAIADNKNFIDNLNEQQYIELKDKKTRFRNTAFSTLISLIIGIIAIITFYITLSNNSNWQNKASNSNDSTSIIINKITSQLLELQKQVSGLNIDTSIQKGSIDIKINSLSKRIKDIETSVSTNPDRLLKLQEINFKFQQLETNIQNEKEIADLKLTNVKEKLDQVVIWTSGLIITILGSIIGFAINAFRKN